VLVRKGRFGPYAQHGNIVANLPRDVMMDDITMAQAVELLAGKGKALKPRGRRGAKGKAPAKAAPKAAAAKATAAPAKAEPPAKPKAAAKKKKAKPKAAAKPAAPRRKAAG
jgi:DNA topoisomerase-1